jgi:hypothetical protein
LALAPILDAIIGGALRKQRVIHGGGMEFTRAHELMEKYQVPVMLEFILERGTNISMGTEIDGVNEFEEILWLDPKLSIKKDRVDGCRSWAKLSCGAGNPAGWRGLPGGAEGIRTSNLFRCGHSRA